MKRFCLMVPTAIGCLLLSGVASAETRTFAFTGAEQTYTAPAGVSHLYVTATGARGGGTGTGGRGALVSGTIAVSPGQTLYVEVGGIGGSGGFGGSPQGGFNGGGSGGSRNGLSAAGGGGASDVRTTSRSSAGSLGSRLIVAGGGGGQLFPGVGGGNAGQPGTGCCGPGPSLLPAAGGGAGTSTAGGAGGCTAGGTGCGSGCADVTVSCGHDGSLGVGGDGGSVGDAAATREGSGGGGGLWGGGGGAAVVDSSVGGGGGGSSLVPSGGVQSLAAQADAPTIVISTRVPKYLALEIPVYSCLDSGSVLAGTHVIDVSYIDKGSGDRHLEMTNVVPVPAAAGLRLTAAIGGTQFATFTLDSNGSFAPIELTGSGAVPAIVDGNASVEIGVPDFGGFIAAASYCGP